MPSGTWGIFGGISRKGSLRRRKARCLRVAHYDPFAIGLPEWLMFVFVPFARAHVVIISALSKNITTKQRHAEDFA